MSINKKAQRRIAKAVSSALTGHEAEVERLAGKQANDKRLHLSEPVHGTRTLFKGKNK